LMVNQETAGRMKEYASSGQKRVLTVPGGPVKVVSALRRRSVPMVWITTVTGVWIVKIKQETATTILIVNVTQRENDAYTTVIAARTGVTGGNANNYKNISKL